MSATTPEATRAMWTAPATDPAMLKAVALILVELLLVTAIALFFSTFSSPFLSAVLTLGLWVIGQFNADLRNFEAVVDVARGGVAGARPLLRAAELRGLRRASTRWCTPCRNAGGLPGDARRCYGARLHRAPARGRRARVRAAGLQVSGHGGAAWLTLR